MRLTCPNCGAQYEVPDEVIPETGRDVQCSNCGDTWFQHHPDHLASKDEPSPDTAEHPKGDTSASGQDYDADADADYDVIPEGQDDQNGHPAETDDSHTSSEDGPDISDDHGDEDDQNETTPAEGTQRRELDPAIRDLLREEAEREKKARAADSGSLETQTEMGLEDSGEDQRTREARERMARLRGLDAEETPPSDPQPSDTGPQDPAQEDDSRADIDPESRRNLLPDIDEINSSLDSDPTPRPEAAVARDAVLQTAPRKSGGFRRGFVLTVLLFAALTLIYVFAPQIAGLHPTLEAPMVSYVTTIDSLRSLLNDAVASFME